MMHYRHIYTVFCIIIKQKVMFWKLYTRTYFNVGTFKIYLWVKSATAFLTKKILDDRG